MRLRELIVPQEKIFFHLLTEQSQILVRGAEALYEMLTDYHDIHMKAAGIKETEHAGDNVAHELYVKLNTTFVTPLDREDIMTVASRCDDVLDAIDAAAQRILTFEIEEPTEIMRSLARLILKATREINVLMMNIKKADQRQVDRGCEEVDMIENQGDELLHAAIGDLFRRNDVPVLEIIKLKEIYEWLEAALDRCEDVTYAIADIVMKNR
jgi:predicted phosphate transport protein (TIGR00153 family)